MIVVDIDMPENCIECWFRGYWNCSLNSSIGDVEEYSNHRHEDCPIKAELPKGHGRLIDADEIQFENNEFDTYGDYSKAFDAIDQADTIIEADKESEDKE